MRKIKYSSSLVEWNFKNEKIKISINSVIIVSIDKINNYILIESGEKFITQKIYCYAFSGHQLFVCDKQTGQINWNNDGIEHSMEISNILNIGFYLKKKSIVVMYLANEKESMIFDLNGDFMAEVEKIPNYEMIYFQEFHDYVSIVMEGNSQTSDMYNRSSKNFKLNLLTGELEEVSLSY